MLLGPSMNQMYMMYISNLILLFYGNLCISSALFPSDFSTRFLFVLLNSSGFDPCFMKSTCYVCDHYAISFNLRSHRSKYSLQYFVLIYCGLGSEDDA
jgi:hypothetical protein